MLNLMEDTLVPCEKVHPPLRHSHWPVHSRMAYPSSRSRCCFAPSTASMRKQTHIDGKPVPMMMLSLVCHPQTQHVRLLLLPVMTPLLALVFPTCSGADEFLPVLILVVANCHLRHPATAVALIRHLTPDADLHGEVLYYLTAFESAL